MLNNNIKARKINNNGNYEKVNRGLDVIDSQNYFMHYDFNGVIG